MTSNDIHLLLLNSYSQKLKKSLTRLESALFKCQKIQLHIDLDDEDMEAFESLTARFARSADMFLNRYVRAAVIAEDPAFRGTFKDFLNQAEKQKIIASVAAWMEVRELRNKIAHEYEENDLLKIFESVLIEAPKLLTIRSSLK